MWGVGVGCLSGEIYCVDREMGFRISPTRPNQCFTVGQHRCGEEMDIIILPASGPVIQLPLASRCSLCWDRAIIWMFFGSF